MPILDFFPKEKPVNSLIQKEADPSKYDIIAAKLCDKRIVIEEDTKKSNDTEREAFALRLIEIKDAMRTFGITEIDYQAYLAQMESKKVTTTPIPNVAPQTNSQSSINTEDSFHD